MAHAYPNFIGYGYVSCKVCHYNPYGNGPLNDYGRVVGSTLISNKPFYNPSIGEEKLANQSGVLFANELPDWLRAAADFRILMLQESLQEDFSNRRWIPMQMDVSLIVRSSSQRHYAVATAGYYPKDRVRNEEGLDDKLPIVSREHYINVGLSRALSVGAGMTDVIYGLRHPDHIAYNRRSIGFGENDQSHGLYIHYMKRRYELGLHGLLGNMFQSAPLRQKGVSMTGEFSLLDWTRLGASLMYTQNEYRKRILASTHFRTGYGKGSALLAELGLVNESTNIPNTLNTGYVYLQNNFLLARGLHLAIVAEYLQEFWDSGGRTVRFGPSLQFYLMPRVELRADLFTKQYLGATAFSENTVDGLFQVHLWF